MDLWRIQLVSVMICWRTFRRNFYCRHLTEPEKTLEAMLNTKITAFPGHIQSVYYHNILKVITHVIISSENSGIVAKDLVSMAITKMSVFLSSGDVEAQERVCFRIVCKCLLLKDLLS